MYEEDYLVWKEHKRSYLVDILKYDVELANHIIWWFDNIKGKKEVQLIQDQNPKFEHSTDEEVLQYIDIVRGCTYWEISKDVNPKGFLNFDMMFAFYTPLIIKEYNAKNTNNKKD